MRTGLKSIYAIGTGGRREAGASAFVGQRDFGSADNRARGIGNDAGNGAGVNLSAK